MKRRETVAERDERIVAEAGPWVSDGIQVYCEHSMPLRKRGDAVDALCRIANRIARKRRGK